MSLDRHNPHTCDPTPSVLALSLRNNQSNAAVYSMSLELLSAGREVK